MKFNFTIRLYQDNDRHCLGDISDITISNITILSKQSKFGGVCEHNGNKKKFGYSFKLSKPFSKIGGSHNYPVLCFNGEYIDIEVKDFPRYPAFCQEYSAAHSILNGYGYHNYMNKGFPDYLLHRKIEIIKLN